MVRADARLQPAGANQTVLITAEAPQIETESPPSATTLDNREITELPRDSRDIYTFLYLNPNISQGAGDGSFKFLGAQTYGASFSLDGQRSNGGVFGEPTASQPSLEAVGELTVLSNNFTAEYAGIANIRVAPSAARRSITASLSTTTRTPRWPRGTSATRSHRPLSCRRPRSPSIRRPIFNLNEFGGSLGGPVPKVKNTYFLFAYERRWSDAPGLSAQHDAARTPAVDRRFLPACRRAQARGSRRRHAHRR